MNTYKSKAIGFREVILCSNFEDKGAHRSVFGESSKIEYMFHVIHSAVCPNIMRHSFIKFNYWGDLPSGTVVCPQEKS